MAMILTLGFDSRSFARLAAERERHFPPARNFIQVHVTLFQQLADHAHLRLLADLAAEASTVPVLTFEATGIVDFGGGAAIEVACPSARELQTRLRRRWSDILTPGDDRPRQLHVTVQNKVYRDTARKTQAALRAGFTPWQGLFDRLLLWHYRGGPWEPAKTFPLTGE